MNRLFYGKLLSNATHEIKNLDYLLIRATSGFFPEKSIDEALIHLKKSQEYLDKAKKFINNPNQRMI